MTETLALETNERILTIALHRPARLNAFTVTMANELIDSLVEADQNDAINAVVVTGSGRAFCSGMDLTGQGNVFGLNERLCPTPQELREGLDEPLLRDGARDPGALGVINPVAAHISESLALLHTSKAHGREGVRAFLDKRPPDFGTTTHPMPELFANRDRGHPDGRA